MFGSLLGVANVEAHQLILGAQLVNDQSAADKVKEEHHGYRSIKVQHLSVVI